MSAEPLLRVSSIQVEGLFDLFDHQVDLKPDERATILHGPNGVGKTMLLRMVNDLLIGRYNLFLQVPFRRFILILTDGSKNDGGSKIEQTVDPHPNQAEARSSKTLQLSLLEDDKQKETHEVSSSESILSGMEEALVPHMEVLEPHVEAMESHMKAMGPYMEMLRPYMGHLEK